MRVFIIHDGAGRIRGTMASKEWNIAIGVPPGYLIHARDERDLSGSDLQRYLQDIHENHRITMPGEPTLMRIRPQGSKEGS